MNVALVQLQAQPGNLEYNLANHLNWLRKLIPFQPNLVVFPELSLSGYEPSLAKNLLEPLNQLDYSQIEEFATQLNTEIWLGLPIPGLNKSKIGLRITKANGTLTHYAKRFLHADEFPFFEQGKESYTTTIKTKTIKATICYETFTPQIAEEISNEQPDMVIASVAKTEESCLNSFNYLKKLATKTSLGLGIVNAIGPNDSYVSGGLTSFFNTAGEQLGMLPYNKEGILLIDTLQNTAKIIP
ncbi:carbon-nitrogen hydrolase family protein [Flavobacterium sp. ASW18X]|uniref:carbon-nitrogen hydrolase family protein n=1 Tax=Flavobacterium sp. ASW18X TaxID=2572595 RepID=UPI0010ADC645|nr:carbon-nitrogen hydrolase family protein [Flavobacterium sp. ASW18X]TKD62375.1 carbon-nitrogen hydrolase family protein [Flavobacterium sp. ASW18X]